MDAHRVILTTLTKCQLSELKNSYQNDSQTVYGMNRSPDPEESLANFILFLANLGFCGFTFLCMIFVVMACGAFIGNGLTGGVVTLVISVSSFFVTITVQKMKLKLSFSTVISLLIVYWKAKFYKVPMPDIN